MRAGDGIWAMGDVTGKAMFTYTALYQAAIGFGDIMGPAQPPATYRAVPRVTFTDPKVAVVGMSEAEARAASLDVIAAAKQLPASFRGWLHEAKHGVIKLVVVERATGFLVGATVVGPHAGAMLGMLALAVHASITLAELRSMMYAFPTFHGTIGEKLGVLGRGLSTVSDPAHRGL